MPDEQHRLFVYGIFLNQRTRDRYLMSHPEYAVVPNMATYHLYDDIVQAYVVDPQCGAALTGLLVTVDPTMWGAVDKLEQGYERRLVETTHQEKAWIYAAKEDK